MAQWVGCLLHKHKDLSLDPQHQCKNSGLVACNTRDGRILGVHCQPSEMASSIFTESPTKKSVLL